MVEKITVGMQGISAESIASGKRGFCWFPIGKPDAAYHGGKAWVRVQIHAIEDIREQRDVIVADDQGGVKEHTPVELSYQSREGPYQRVTQAYPLPVTLSSRSDIKWANAALTAIGNTEMIAAPDEQSIKVVYIAFSNSDTADALVGLRFTTTGDLHHRTHLVLGGGNFNANLIDTPWLSDNDGEAFYGNLAAAVAATAIYVTIGYILE